MKIQTMILVAVLAASLGSANIAAAQKPKVQPRAVPQALPRVDPEPTGQAAAIPRPAVTQADPSAISSDAAAANQEALGSAPDPTVDANAGAIGVAPDLTCHIQASRPPDMPAIPQNAQIPLDPAKPWIWFSGKVENKGSAPASQGYAWLSIRVGGQAVKTQTVPVNLAPGSAAEFNPFMLDLVGKEAGFDVQASLVADPGATIQESDENDNGCELKFSVVDDPISDPWTEPHVQY